MFASSTCALALALVAAVFVNAVPAPHAGGLASTRTHHKTNAERLSAGLTPLKPRNLSAATKVQRDHDSAHASPSPVLSPVKKRSNPSKTLTGIMSVKYGTNGTLIGYLSRSFTPLGQYTLSTDPTKALEVSFGALNKKYFDLRATSPHIESLPYLGAISSGLNGDDADALKSGSWNHVHIGFTSQTSIMSPPVNAPNGITQFTTVSHKMESSIWNYDAGTRSITPLWVNPDGKPFESGTVVFVPREGTFCLVGDHAAYERTFQYGSIPVELSFIADA